MLNEIKVLWERHGATVVAAVRTSWDFISTKIGTTLDIILGSLETVIKVLNGDFSGAWRAIKNTVATVSRAMQNAQAVAVAGMIAGFYKLKREAGLTFLHILEDISALGNAYILLPFVDPITRAAVAKGLGAVETGMQKIVEGVGEADFQMKVWNSKAADAMSAPFDLGVKKIAEVKAVGDSIPATFEKTGESIIKVFDAAGNSIESGLTGGLGRAAGTMKTQVTEMQTHLNANPLKLTVDVNTEAFYRALAEIGVRPDTAGVLP